MLECIGEKIRTHRKWHIRQISLILKMKTLFGYENRGERQHSMTLYSGYVNHGNFVTSSEKFNNSRKIPIFSDFTDFKYELR